MKKTILIIDDETRLSGVLSYMLKREGYNTLVANNGVQGMTLFNNNLIDLVITDIFMPEKNGFELIKEIKSASPQQKVIVISGGGLKDENNDTDFLTSAKQSGADGVIKKPFLRAEIMSAIKKLL